MTINVEYEKERDLNINKYTICFFLYNVDASPLMKTIPTVRFVIKQSCVFIKNC